MTSSPFLTLTGARSPVSRRLPLPTARTLPRLGFSLAVSGRTMPLLVLDSASTRLTRILSPRGRSFAMCQVSAEKVASCELSVASEDHSFTHVWGQQLATRNEQLATCLSLQARPGQRLS